MAVEPKITRIMNRLRELLIETYPERYAETNVHVTHPRVLDTNRPPKGDQYYIYRDENDNTDEYSDDENIVGAFAFTLNIYAVFTASGKDTDIEKEREIKVAYLHDDFVNLRSERLTGPPPYGSWLRGKKYVADTPIGAYSDLKVLDTIVVFAVEFDNEGSFFTTS
jgi:hypothetical protein